jgi:DNA-binding transcriptional LysR family regulator
MGLDTIDLPQLRALDALLRERNVTRAAERLGVSQPALSHTLAKLRAATGDALFVRTPRGVAPTPRASALGPELRAILSRLENLLDHAPEFSPTRLKRSFVIGCADFVELRIIPELLATVAREAPDVDLLVRPQSAVADEELESGRADLVVGVVTTRSAGLVAKKLFDEGFLTVARADHPEIGRTLDLDTYVRLHHAQIAPRGQPGGPVDDALAALGLSRRVSLRIPTFLPALDVVAKSDLVLTAPEGFLRDVSRTHALRVHRPPLEIRPFPLTLVWHERLQHDPAARWLRERVAAILLGYATRRDAEAKRPPRKVNRRVERTR